jgi:hypothetical protein
MSDIVNVLDVLKTKQNVKKFLSFYNLQAILYLNFLVNIL